MHRLRDAVLVPTALAFLVAVLLVVGPPVALFLSLRGLVLRAFFHWAHRRHGRFVLFVYSESPNWQSYVEEHVLPRLVGRAAVLNWSQRKQWPRLSPWEAQIFHHFAGPREFNPLALVFVGRWRVVRIPFYRAFLDLKHGRESTLRQAEAELFAYLASSDTAAA